jgi:putative intracellular protease/amidase
MCKSDGADRRHVIAGAVAAAGLTGLGSPAAAQAKAIYICPPCGCPADGREFAAPGTCPSCGMTLIEKSALPAAAAQPTRQRVAILVFEGVQIIDFAGPYEVFGQAGYEVFTVGATTAPLKTAMGLTITPAFTFADHRHADVLVIPGGNINSAMHDKPTLDWISARSAATRATMSVCNGALILAATGLLDGLTATTFHGALDSLKTQFPRVTVVEDKRFVDNGRIITTAGLSSGIDGAMHVVSRQEGKLDAQLVARNLEYDWKEDSDYARAALADYPLDGIFGTRLRLVLPGATAKLEKSAGDRRQWEVSWLVDGPASGQAIAAAIETKIATATPLRAERQDTPSPQRNWRFVDPRGRAWVMTLDVADAGSVKRARMVAILVK